MNTDTAVKNLHRLAEQNERRLETLDYDAASWDRKLDVAADHIRALVVKDYVEGIIAAQEDGEDVEAWVRSMKTEILNRARYGAESRSSSMTSNLTEDIKVSAIAEVLDAMNVRY